ncbi:MAG TPA: hypothetical protein VK111_15575 [Virgibacillus sp.]|nr:hypothetical protein [Virgibacillus sp.]
MEENDWILDELDHIDEQESSTHQQAIILAAKQIIREQDKRIWQMEGEMDGTLWSPKRWDE